MAKVVLIVNKDDMLQVHAWVYSMKFLPNSPANCRGEDGMFERISRSRRIETLGAPMPTEGIC